MFGQIGTLTVHLGSSTRRLPSFYVLGLVGCFAFRGGTFSTQDRVSKAYPLVGNCMFKGLICVPMDEPTNIKWEIEPLEQIVSREMTR